ncbi:hypothetical protein T492DRAFT_1009319, partial [Pavlovales sp. CCMP2436]
RDTNDVLGRVGRPVGDHGRPLSDDLLETFVYQHVVLGRTCEDIAADHQTVHNTICRKTVESAIHRFYTTGNAGHATRTPRALRMPPAHVQVLLEIAAADPWLYLKEFAAELACRTGAPYVQRGQRALRLHAPPHLAQEHAAHREGAGRGVRVPAVDLVARYGLAAADVRQRDGDGRARTAPPARLGRHRPPRQRHRAIPPRSNDFGAGLVHLHRLCDLAPR